MILGRTAIGLLALAAALPAQRSALPPDRLERVRAVLDGIYRIDYEAARARCQEMIRLWPDDPVGYVYLARVYWQELLIEDRALTVERFTRPDYFSETPRYKAEMDPAAERRFQEANREAIAKARAYAQARPKEPAALFLLGLAYQSEATFHIALRNDWLAAIRAGNKSYRANQDLLALSSQYADARLVVGVYNYTAGSLPWKIRWLALLLGYQGSTGRGRKDLEEAAERGMVSSSDARSMLALIYARENKLDLALGKLAELKSQYPENYLTHLDIAGLESRRGRPLEAVKLYREALEKIAARAGGYRGLEPAIVYNQLGIACRAAKEMEAADEWFRRTLEGEASPRSKTLAALELAKTLDLRGLRAEAVALYRRVESGPDIAGAHREAKQYLLRPFER